MLPNQDPSGDDRQPEAFWSICAVAAQDAALPEIAQFSNEVLGAAAGIFSWIEGGLYEEKPDLQFGVAEGFIAEYHAGAAVRRDPLRSMKDKGSSERVGVLSQMRASASEGSRRPMDEYAAFLEAHGYGDNLAFSFHCGEQPVAMLGLFTNAGDEFRFDAAKLGWVYRFLQYALGSHPRFETLQWRTLGTKAFDLTSRESEIVELIAAGASNKKIGLCLNISLPTVKTHVGHIFDKMGLENRMGVIVRMRRLEAEARQQALASAP